jgi:hypothetical protein
MACEVNKGIAIDQGHSKWLDFYLGCHFLFKSKR